MHHSILIDFVGFLMLSHVVPAFSAFEVTRHSHRRRSRPWAQPPQRADKYKPHWMGPQNPGGSQKLWKQQGGINSLHILSSDLGTLETKLTDNTQQDVPGRNREVQNGGD